MDLDKFVIDSGRWIRLVLFILGPLRRALLNVLFENGIPKDPSDLYNYFNAKRQVLKKNRYINHNQMEILLPPGKTQTDSGLFDITLILTLIQDFSDVLGSKKKPTEPPFNWQDKKPTGTGLAACCVVARNLRNEILGHYPDPTLLSLEDFKRFWTKLEVTLQDLGSKERVEELVTQSLYPKQRMVLQSLILYLQTQQEGFKDRLDDFETTQTTTNQDVEQRLQALEKLEIKVSQVDVTSEEYAALFCEIKKQVLESHEQRLTLVEDKVEHMNDRLDDMDDTMAYVVQGIRLMETNSDGPTQQFGLPQDQQEIALLNDPVPVVQKSNIDERLTIEDLSRADIRKLSDLVIKGNRVFYNWEIFLRELELSTNPDLKLSGVENIVVGLKENLLLEVGRRILEKLSVSKPRATLLGYIEEIKLDRPDIVSFIEDNGIENVSFNDILQPKYSKHLIPLIEKITCSNADLHWKDTAELLLKPCCGGNTGQTITLIESAAEGQTKFDDNVLQSLFHNHLRIRLPKMKLRDMHDIFLKLKFDSVATTLGEIAAKK